MLRILQVVNIMDRAGLETMLMNYYRNVDRTQIQFDFLTHRQEEGAYDKEIHSLGGRVYQAPRLYPQNYIQYFKFMKEFFAEHPEYAIVHSHIDTMSVFPLGAAQKSGIPVRIAHSHNTRIDKDFKYLIKEFGRILTPHVSNVYCACGVDAGKFMFRKKNFKVIHNAIDLERYQFDENIRKKKRQELGIGCELVVGHVGRYRYVKNQSFLLEIFEQICRKIPNAKLLLIGKGEDEQMLRNRAKTLKISENVLFLRDRSDVHELYQVMDIFVMPSLFEGLPVVGIEAQANGLPCVVSDQISEEMSLTDAVVRKSLKDSPAEWAETILEMDKRRQISNMEQLRKEGYDIKEEALKLEAWYDSKAEEIRIGGKSVI